jgi:hypothetical protein
MRPEIRLQSAPSAVHVVIEEALRGESRYNVRPIENVAYK